MRQLPKGKELHAPSINLNNIQGQIDALKNPAINVRYLAFEKLKQQGIILSNGLIHNVGPVSLNSTRMGFAWMNEKEAETAVGVLNKT